MWQSNVNTLNYAPLNSTGLPNNTNKIAGNNLTIRGNDIVEQMPKQLTSRNITQASLRALRLYRRICRLIPFIIRIHHMESQTTPAQAQVNVANWFRKFAHLRDPAMVDHWVYKGQEHLYQAEWHVASRDHLTKFLCSTHWNDRGYSYLEETLYKNKSQFLQDFYRGDKPYEY